MGKETKIGLVVVVVLAVFLGAFVVQRSRRPEAEPVLVETTAPQSEPGFGGLESPPVVVETGGFSSDLSTGHESNDLSETLLDVPMGPGTGGDDAFDEPYENQFSNAPSDAYDSNLDAENRRAPEPSRWASRRTQTDGRSLDEAPASDPGTVDLAGPEFETVPLDAVESDRETWESSPSGQTPPVTRRGSSTTEVVDDARSSAGYEDGFENAPTLFEEVNEPLSPPATAPLAQAIEPRSTFPARSLETEQWVVQDGDSFWSISRHVYGAGRYFKALARWNQKTVPDPARMRTGTVVETPPVALLEQADPQLVSKKKASSTSTLPGLEGLPVPEQAGAFAGPLGRKYYHVGRTDTLFGISKKTLGQGGRWKELFDLNGDILEDPDHLAPGMILRLPSSAAVEVILSSRPESGVIR